jgi:arylsulfatase
MNLISKTKRTGLKMAVIFGLLPITIWSGSILQAQPLAGAQGTADEQPNIILIVADDLGYGEVGCYGQTWIQTPNIDKIAETGIRFTQFYCGQAVCAPSRCSLMTGMHQGHAWIRDNGNPPERGNPRPDDLYFPGQHPIPDETVTVAELLKSKGYATAAIGKWGLGPVGSSGDPNRQGFDLFYGFNCQVHAHNHYPRFLWRNDQQERLPGNDRTMYGDTYSQDKFAEEAMKFVRANQKQPFFLYLPFAIPHLAIQVPEKSLAEFRGDIVEEAYEHRGYLPFPEPRAGYAAMISHMDRDIGNLMQLLDELELSENTLILFSSDNGPTYDRLGGSDSDYFQSSGPLRGRKGSLLEGGIRVPLVARWPGKIAPGTTTEHISAFWDLLPTFCQIVNMEPPAGIDGISLLPTLTGAGQQVEHDYLYWEFPAYGGQQAVRWNHWKAFRGNLQKNPDASFELYDLSNDIGESTNVAAEHPDVIRKITGFCRQSHVPSALFPFAALDQ